MSTAVPLNSIIHTDHSRCSVDRREIPLDHQKLYDAAAESRLFFVKSLSHHPNDLGPEFIITKPLEDHLIFQVEQSYNAAADKCEYRPAKSSEYKRGVAIFFEGRTTLGDDCPYTALIPFFVSGDVVIGGKQLEERYCYDIFGKCVLEVPKGGKVGSWMISFVK